jgi:outer membrane protein OmpA-like peptidoglycan-associated protein
MLVAIIGILCFVAGLLVFSLRNPSYDSGSAAMTRRATEVSPAEQPTAEEAPAEPSVDERSALAATNAPSQVGDGPEVSSSNLAAVNTAPPNPEPITSPEPASDPFSPLPSTQDQAALLEDILSDSETLIINFQIDSNELTSEDIQDLDRIAALLNARDDIRGQGHRIHGCRGQSALQPQSIRVPCQYRQNLPCGQGSGGGPNHRQGHGAGQSDRLRTTPSRGAAETVGSKSTCRLGLLMRFLTDGSQWDPKQKFKTDYMVLSGLLVATIFWLIDSILHIFFFNEFDIVLQLIGPNRIQHRHPADRLVPVCVFRLPRPVHDQCP